MNTNELIEALEQQFGNQYAPKRYLIIQEAIKQLRILSEEVHHLYAQNSGANK
jgi:hypothetical protein